MDRKSILIVEDDEFSRDLARLLLEKAGYEVTTASDGVDGVALLEKTRYDLILSDLQMPNLDGFKLLQVTRLKGIATPVVFLTAQNEKETEVQALELGAADFIHKPFKKETLLSRVKSALES